MKKLILIASLLFVCTASVLGETEPNDLPGQANVLLYNGLDTGSLSGTDIYDWFYFDLPEAGIWQLTVRKTGGGNCWLNLRAGEGATQDVISTLYLSYWDTPAEGELWSVPLLPGRYYIQLQKGDYTVHYQIASQLSPPQWASDAEPDNSAATAILLPVNSTTGGTLHYNEADAEVDQEDWYEVDVPQGGILRVTARKRGAGNAWIYLRDGENAALPELTNIYLSYFESPPEGWAVDFPAMAGKYYLHVANGGGVVNYEIKVDLIPPAFPEDPEPNDSQTIAAPFPMNDSVSGLMGYYKVNSGFDAADWYVLNVPDKGLLDFRVTKIGFSNGNVRLRDGNGDIGGAYAGYGDWVATFSNLLPAGTYYLVVEKLELDFQYKIDLHYTQIPVAGFTFRRAGNTVAFENASLRGETFAWNFDDGAVSAAVNAYHEYTQPADYNVCLVAANAGGKDTVCQPVVIPGLARVYPDKAGNTGDATLRVFGGGLDTSYQVRLMQGGVAVAQSSFTGFAGKGAIMCLIDLRDKPAGVCDVVVEKAGGPSYKLPGGFTIQPGTSPDPWVSITGRDRILFNTWTTFTVNYGNNGNVDARLVPVWFVFSQDPGLEVEFPNAYFYDPDTAATEAPEAGLYTELDSVFGKPFPARIYPLLIPLIPAGSVQSFPIRIKTSGNLRIEAWTEKPWYQSPLNENKMECMSDALSAAPPDFNLNEDRVLCAKLFTALFYDRILDDYFIDARSNPSLNQPEWFSSVLKCLRAAVKICGVSNADDRKQISDWMTNWILNRFLQDRNIQAKGGAYCPLEFEPQNLQSKPMTAVSSLDPNEKAGLPGYGAQRYLASREELPYTIHFENTATATAPAHAVTVTDQLDTTEFDLNTFSFGDVSIAGQRIGAGAGAREFVQDYFLENAGVTVRILGALDAASGKVEWVFRSLDPVTLADIDDPDRGFLPPNLAAPEGEGSVSFSVRLKTPPQQDEQVRNEASVVFDANVPFSTNLHLLTFDVMAPASAVDALPPLIYDNPFEVRWSGSDAGSGVDYYNIFVSVNGGEDSLWIAATADSAAMFAGETGKTYRFYSVAADHAGNRELAPAEPDAETTLTVGTVNPSGDGGEPVLYPNPADNRLIVLYTGSGEARLTLADVNGRVVRRLYFSQAGKQEIATGGLSNGFYIWTWTPLRTAPSKSGKLLILHE